MRAFATRCVDSSATKGLQYKKRRCSSKQNGTSYHPQFTNFCIGWNAGKSKGCANISKSVDFSIHALFAYGGAVGLAASFSSWQFYVPIVIVPSVAFQLMFGVIIIAIAMTPIGIWRLRKMDLVEKVKDISQ